MNSVFSRRRGHEGNADQKSPGAARTRAGPSAPITGFAVTGTASHACAPRLRQQHEERAVVGKTANLLDGLFVDEDFRQLIGTPADVPKRNYAQAVLIALAIRHSWREDDLARFLRRAGVRTTNGHAHP